MIKDKPTPAKIILTLVNGKDKGEKFISLSGMLYQNNLIYAEPRELRRNKNHLELSVIFSDSSSFKNWLKNPSIIEYWKEKFDNFLLCWPKTLKERDVILEVDKVENCTCKKSKFYILQGRSFQFESELMCGSCFKNVPYSKIPVSVTIENWQTHHQRIYMNWIASGIFEKSALRELTNYKKGKINIEGERIRKELSVFFKIPVYINYFYEHSESNRFCLICNSKGVKSDLRANIRICKKCNTMIC